MSWKAEVIADSSGKWNDNALRFATKPEAAAYADDLYARWTLVRQTRVVEVDGVPNYRWKDGKLFAIQLPCVPG